MQATNKAINNSKNINVKNEKNANRHLILLNDPKIPANPLRIIIDPKMINPIYALSAILSASPGNNDLFSFII